MSAEIIWIVFSWSRATHASDKLKSESIQLRCTTHKAFPCQGKPNFYDELILIFQYAIFRDINYVAVMQSALSARHRSHWLVSAPQAMMRFNTCFLNKRSHPSDAGYSRPAVQAQIRWADKRKCFLFFQNRKAGPVKVTQVAFTFLSGRSKSLSPKASDLIDGLLQLTIVVGSFPLDQMR